ncbi:hypothetical protein [Lysobacter capsici]|uniref:hypothetical protein n=1 Tax=Lysobacter capsici TaxID=435897 RepID=UPI001C00346A|nr:hypothetical protein [Lysobacter capsici]QWF18695.1 hypothetical protein KME82_08120 [Lysobacter capsici]
MATPISILDLADDSPAHAPDINQQVAIATQRNEGGSTARAQATQARQAEAERVRENSTVGDLIGAAQAQGGIGTLHRMWQEGSVMEHAKEDYRLPEDFAERMQEAGIGQEQWLLFDRATSDEHFELLQSFALQNQAASETQAQFGLAANIAVGLTDPVAFAADAATGGLARAARAGRLVNGVRAGIAAGATNAALTYGASAFNPEIGDDDIVLAAGAGFVLGGALNLRNGDQFVNAKAVQSIVKRDISGSYESIGAAKVHGIPDEPTPGLSRKPLSDTMEDIKDAGVENIELRPAFANIRRSLAARMGNMKSPTVREISRKLFRDGVGYNDRNQAVEQSAGEFAGMHRARFETALQRGYNAAWRDERAARGLSMWDRAAELEWSGQVAQALRGVEVESPAAKAAAARVRKVLDEAFDTGVRNGVLDPGSKNESYFPQIQSKAAYQRIFGEMGLSEDQGIDIYKQAILSDMRKRATANPASADNVAKFNELEENYRGTSEAAKRARERADEINADFALRQQAVRDAEAAVAEDLGTGKRADISRRARQRKLEDSRRRLMRQEERLKGAKEKLADALKREADSDYARTQAKQIADDGGIDEDLAEVYARAIINRGKNQVHGETENMVRSLDLDDLEQLKLALDDAGVSVEKAASILHKYTRKAAEDAKISPAKRRISLDPSFRTVVKNRNGADVEIGVTDFMDSDVSRVVTAYTRDISGWSALSQKLGVKNQRELEALRQLTKREADIAGDDTDTALRMFDIGVRSIMGRSTEVNPNSGGARIARALRDTQFLRVMNQVGFTLFTELGPVVAHAGLRNTLSSISFIGDFMRTAADGTLKSGTARYLDELIATGTEHLRNPVYLRLEDDAFASPTYGNSKIGRAYENLQGQAQRVTSVMSGMAPMNTMLQRIAGRATLMKLLQLANDKRALAGPMLQRLRSYGLDEEAQKALFDSLRGIKKVDDITEAKLSLADRERVAAFMYRVTRQQVLEGDASDSIMLMHSSGGKLVTQFRSFMAYSYERHLLNSAYHWKDWHTWQMVTLSSSLAGLQWAARSYINTAGNEEKRKETLTRANFLKAAVAQSSWGSVIPALTDTLLGVAGEEAVFANTRSTGLSNNLLSGIPSVDFVTRAAEAAKLPVQLIRDDQEITRKELENFSKLFWFQNMTGWQNIQREGFDWLEQEGIIEKKSEVESEARKERNAEKKKKTWLDNPIFN